MGNVSNATEFNTKIVPNETDISSSVAPVIGPTAAMALPPQIAVPVEMRNAGRSGTANQPAQQCAHDHREGDTQGSVEEPAPAGMHHLVQIHPEAQPHDGRLQQNPGERSGFVLIGMGGDCTEDEAGEQSQRR